MGSFTDNKGDMWSVRITGADVAKVGSVLGIDLGNPMQAWADAAKFTPTLMNLLFHLSRNHKEQRPNNAEKFAELFGPATFEDGLKAFEVALTDFFQGTKTGEKFEKALSMAREIEAERDSLAAERMATFDPKSLAKSLLDSSGSWGGKPASTQGPLHTASS